MTNKEIRKEISTAHKTISDSENRLKEIQAQLLENLEYEKAGAVLPYNYSALHAEAVELRQAIKKIPSTVSDAASTMCANIFPTMKYDNSLIPAGTRINWSGKVKKANVDLWDMESTNPQNSPNLWSDIMYRMGIRIIPQTITVTDTFRKDELGWWGNTLYKSKTDNNVYTPEQYSDNWEFYSQNKKE